MTLSPPITQRDVDEGTLFRTRGGAIDRVVGTSKMIGWPWIVECQEVDRSYTVADDGCKSVVGHETKWDLIARIREPNMNQITVEDRRTSVDVVTFDELPESCLFETEHESLKIVRYKGACRTAHLCINGSSMSVIAHYAGRDCRWERCRPLPHLRLTLTLSDATL